MMFVTNEREEFCYKDDIMEAHGTVDSLLQRCDWMIAQNYLLVSSKFYFVDLPFFKIIKKTQIKTMLKLWHGVLKKLKIYLIFKFEKHLKLRTSYSIFRLIYSFQYSG